MEDGGWRHSTGNRPQLRVGGGGGGGGNCREWAGKRTAAVPLARSGTLPQRRSAMESSSSRERGWFFGRAAARPPWLQYAALVAAASRLPPPERRRGHSLLMLRNAARETMRSGVYHIPASVPSLLLSFHASLRSVVGPSIHAPSLSVVSLSSRSDWKMPANSLLPFLPSILFPVDISPLLLLLLPSSEAAKFSSPSAARSPLFASFVSLWSGKRLRLQSVPTRRPRGRTGRHLTPNFMYVGSPKPVLPLLKLNIPKWNIFTIDEKMPFAAPGAMSEASAACVCE